MTQTRHRLFGWIRQAKVTDIFISILFLSCLAYSLKYSTAGWNNPLLDHHQFRQTQTAITSYYMIRGGPWLNYDTPVLGPPWSIPLEFPVYQWVVAAIVALSHAPVDQTGRLTSLAFFYLSFIPGYFLLRDVGISRRSHRLVFMCLLLVSPTYLFWSRTVMIESTALFFNLSFLAFVARYAGSRKTLAALAAVLLGALGALIKITTFVSFGVAAALVLFRPFLWTLQSGGWRGAARQYVLAVTLIAGIPMIAGVVWTRYAEDVRSQNPMGAEYLSFSALKIHNFGTMEQRLSLDSWTRILVDRVGLVAGSVKVLFLLPLVMLLLRRRILFFLSSFLLFLTGPLFFMNLHVEHDYYSYANGLFFLASIAVVVVAMLENDGLLWRMAGVGTLCLFLLSMGRIYWQNVKPQWQDQDFHNSDMMTVARTIQRFTKSDDVILIYGDSMSSAIPYYSERRAVADHFDQEVDSPIMKKMLANLDSYRIGAIVVCNKSRELSDRNNKRLQELNFENSARFHSKRCDIFVRRNQPE